MDQGNELAGIEYHGVAGASQECQNAVMRLLQFGDGITRARIVSCSDQDGLSHCLLLTNDIGDQIAIKSGFSSGYLGEGPTRFSYVLQFLYAYGAKIDECIVDEAIVARLDNSALTVSDLEKINAVKPVRANRWRNYVLERHENALDRRIWAEFPHVIPFAVIDSRILDLTLSFWANPDDKLLKAYRRLEDAVRERTA